jgi:hypothetical protein
VSSPTERATCAKYERGTNVTTATIRACTSALTRAECISLSGNFWSRARFKAFNTATAALRRAGATAHAQITPWHTLATVRQVRNRMRTKQPRFVTTADATQAAQQDCPTDTAPDETQSVDAGNTSNLSEAYRGLILHTSHIVGGHSKRDIPRWIRTHQKLGWVAAEDVGNRRFDGLSPRTAHRIHRADTAAYTNQHDWTHAGPANF